jgi:capsule synthesis protein PGA_cap
MTIYRSRSADQPEDGAPAQQPAVPVRAPAGPTPAAPVPGERPASPAASPAAVPAEPVAGWSRPADAPRDASPPATGQDAAAGTGSGAGRPAAPPGTAATDRDGTVPTPRNVDGPDQVTGGGEGVGPVTAAAEPETAVPTAEPATTVTSGGHATPVETPAPVEPAGPAPAGGSARAEPAGRAPAEPEPAGPARPRRGGRRRPGVLQGRARWLAVAAAVVLAAAGVGGATVLRSGSGSAGTVKRPATTGAPAPSASAPAPAGAGGVADVITLSATGDIIMGSAPGSLPPAGGKDFFLDVKAALDADLQMGNLEQPLTNDTGVSKCAGSSPAPGQKSACFAFRSPPSYATVLRDAGFDLLNLANNHAYDFGAEGNRQTRSALESAGLAHTGAPGQITVVNVKGVRVAVLGFAPYAWAQSLTDIGAAAALVKRAKAGADLVVVQMHVGAEGADQTHVRPGTEFFLGENRGDSIRFAHAVVDAGADLVVGHGPHVMRAIEFYRGRLVAYSLGNFAGYRSLSYTGVVGVGGILKVSLHRDGTWAAGSLVATHMVAPGLPALDPAGRALALVRSLCATDVPVTGARVQADGSLVAPQA